MQGWHSGATLGVFSSAAGAAAGLKLPEDQVVHALGLAGTVVLAALAPAVPAPAGPLPRAEHPVVWLVALGVAVAFLGLSGQIVL